MARIRTIKPEFREDERMARCSHQARLTFILIWTICDDYGRFRGSPAYLRHTLFPNDEDLSTAEVAGWVDELAAMGRIRLYDVDGERYGCVVNWQRHQQISKPGASRLPLPPEDPANPAENPRNIAPDLGPRTLDLGPRTGDRRTARTPSKPHRRGKPVEAPHGSTTPPTFDQFWDAWPPGRQVSRPTAEKAWAAAAAEPDAEGILPGVARWAAYWTATAKPTEFIPKPATWLRDRAWRDPTPTPTTNGHGQGDELRDAVAEFLARSDDP